MVEQIIRLIVHSRSILARDSTTTKILDHSTIGVDEVANWQAKYHLSDDVFIRISGPIDRASDFGVDEVPVYEVFFESGFRDRVTSLVAKVSEALEISPGQLNPPSWRTLIAL